ncbi:MerR family transcriptional regulator [Mangrovihabitans endophyticus]|uniref:MerR family transcriptional regulator n=1 Tax=Mangrovihabitans endophyticus TaxID=1751298 RepID=UPI001E49C259|nr:MerR family transcriptional regulator [Mangrovihabitans endophyticus]
MRYGIGEVAARTGVSVHAIRFYEREGIIGPAERLPGGNRTYSAEDIDWLDHCVVLRGSGLSVKELCRYRELVRRGDGTESERIALLAEHARRIEHRQRLLDQALQLVRHKIAVYEDVLEGTANIRCIPGGDGAGAGDRRR